MMSESIVKDYRLGNKGWEQLICYETENEELVKEWCGCVITDVPVETLLITYEDLVLELSEKEVELANVKETYNLKEFKIVYQSDIDFKALYGSTAEKVRKQHATNVLSELGDKKLSLELSIAFIQNYIPLLREVLRSKSD